jgi:hypothetical protein
MLLLLLAAVGFVKANKQPAGAQQTRDVQIWELMKLLGIQASLPEVQRMVANVDTDGSGALDFQEFLQEGFSIACGRLATCRCNGHAPTARAPPL